MTTIHLNMMELEGYWQSGLEQSLSIFAPHHHWIAELISVLVDDAIELRLYHGGCADNHAVTKGRTLKDTVFLIVLWLQARVYPRFSVPKDF